MKISYLEACSFLSSGKNIAIPTETVYGLAASLSFPEAIDRIFFLKNRPANNPLIIHVSHPHQIFPFLKEIPPEFELLSRTFWPGPLTIVLPVKESISEKVRSGLPTAAFRIPNHPLTLQLLEQVGPLVAPSANISGKPSPTTPKHVEEDFGIDFPVLDGGNCIQGLESTILHHADGAWHIIRQGALAQEAFNPILGYSPTLMSTKDKPICPGQLYRHYAPEAKLLLGGTRPPQVAVLGFSDRSYPDADKIFLLGSSTNPTIVASNLYAILRQLDEEKIPFAWIDNDFPQSGLWLTIAERLQKAAFK